MYVAIVLCAGFGTRLAPLTRLMPKAAVPVGSMPVAMASIAAFLRHGFDTVHVNLHHMADDLERELTAATRSLGFDPRRLRFWHEREILETGGGIANILQTLRREGTPVPKGVIATAGDVYSVPPIDLMIRHWEARPENTTALLMTRPVPYPRNDVVWVNTQTNLIAGFGPDVTSPSPEIQQRLFTTQQILSPDIVYPAPIERVSSREVFFRASLARGQRLLSVPAPDDLIWHDIGTPVDYAACIARHPCPQAEAHGIAAAEFAGWLQSPLPASGQPGRTFGEALKDALALQARPAHELMLTKQGSTSRLVIGVPERFADQPGALIPLAQALDCLNGQVSSPGTSPEICLLFR